MNDEALNILIVDDSRIYRHLVENALKEEDNINIVGSVMNGVKAMEFIQTHEGVDLVSLDIEMPEKNGLETLLEIEEFNKKNGKSIACIMLSAVTKIGSDTTIKALEGGAFDFITKPSFDNVEENERALKLQLLAKIRDFRLRGSPSSLSSPASFLTKQKPLAESPKIPEKKAESFSIKKTKTVGGVKAILIGCSTGGPKALMDFMPELCAKTTQPILLVQHMPPDFTKSLAESLDRKCDYKFLEAQGEEIVQERHVYIAPGGRHMVLRKDSDGHIITGINDQPPENGCRPSVDVLFRSASSQYGGNCVAVILTGMGKDGTKGIAPLHRAGAYIIVQDEPTSVVWGMPGSAVESGKTHEALPLSEIAAAVARRCK